MRKIEQLMLNAVKNKTNFSLDNTRVSYEPKVNSSAIYLHNNHIATFVHYTESIVANVETFFCWPTRTTASRLRALGVNATIKHGDAAIDGVIL